MPVSWQESCPAWARGLKQIKRKFIEYGKHVAHFQTKGKFIVINIEILINLNRR